MSVTLTPFFDHTHSLCYALDFTPDRAERNNGIVELRDRTVKNEQSWPLMPVKEFYPMESVIPLSDMLDGSYLTKTYEPEDWRQAPGGAPVILVAGNGLLRKRGVLISTPDKTQDELTLQELELAAKLVNNGLVAVRNSAFASVNSSHTHVWDIRNHDGIQAGWQPYRRVDAKYRSKLEDAPALYQKYVSWGMLISLAILPGNEVVFYAIRSPFHDHEICDSYTHGLPIKTKPFEDLSKQTQRRLVLLNFLGTGAFEAATMLIVRKDPNKCAHYYRLAYHDITDPIDPACEGEDLRDYVHVHQLRRSIQKR
jgi:hypothetical protein